jgi:type II secretory pathway pseudopilin PulG
MRSLLSIAIVLGVALAAIPAVQGKQQDGQAASQQTTQQAKGTSPAEQEAMQLGQQAAIRPTPPTGQPEQPGVQPPDLQDKLQALQQVNPHPNPYLHTGAEKVHGDRPPAGTYFHTSERCVACHNGMKTSDGEDVSIGLQWQASIMANASRDPYWQGSLRRETIDHPESTQFIENDCSTCHMPAKRMPDRDRGKPTGIFATFPLDKFPHGDKAAADGVTCAVCHQIAPDTLGTEASYSGDVTFSPALTKYLRAEYGPFQVTQGHKVIMHSSTATYVPTQAAHMREAALCGSCHTLYTNALGPGGEKIGRLAEQMPFLEWQHSNFYGTTQTCQSCHMPVVKEAVAVTALYGEKREGLHRHVFVGGNFLVQGMLQDHRDELATVAQPEELITAAKRTETFLRTQSAKLSIPAINRTNNQLIVAVHVDNLGGHKLPTAYPSRRVWLHVTVKDAQGHVVFESGHFNADGSIVGNVNDRDPLKYEPHFREITRPDQVEIYEPILKDSHGQVTTGLLNAVGYLKDNRLLPRGFDKATAVQDIAVIGAAAADPGFNDTGSTVRYIVPTGNATGPLQVSAELWYQPIGFRWAHNLAPYQAIEPKRMVRYYKQAANTSAMVLARAEATR